MLSQNAKPIEFANLAHDVTRNHLEDKDHRFALPSDLMFNGRDSPVGPMLDEALMRAFTTAQAALRGNRENFSGFTIAGTKGSGKSTLTRLVALLSGLLIPNFQSVFVDLVRCEKLEIDRILLEAAVVCGIPGVTANDSLRTVIGRFAQNKCGFGLFLDELPALCKKSKQDKWAKIHSILDSTCPTFVIANGSASSLPAMVRRDIRDLPLLEKLLGPQVAPFVSLNGTKIKVKMLSRFTKPIHYHFYLRHRPHVCKDLRPESAPEDEFIKYLHLVSGGVLRRIRQVNENSKSLDLADWLNSYPDNGTLEKAIFDKLVEPVLSGTKKFDVFDMPQISEDELERLMDEHCENKSKERVSIHDLVDNDMLQVIEKGTSRSYTFGNPAYFKLSLRAPVMFISHRMEDGPELDKLIEGLCSETGKTIRVVACEDGSSQETIRKRGLNKYMDIMCVTGITDEGGEKIRRVAVVLLTDLYVKRIEEYFSTNIMNGCSRELLKVLESDRSHLYFFKAANLNRAEAIKRLESANDQWKGKLGDLVIYNLEEPKHFKLLANSVISHAYQGEIEHVETASGGESTLATSS